MSTIQLSKRNHIKETRADRILNYVINTLLILLVLVVVYPLYFVIIASFSDPVAVSGGKLTFYPIGLNVDAYKRIFNDSRIWTGYKNTLFYTTFGTLLGVMLTIMAGYSFSRKDLKGSGFLMTLYIITMYFGGGLIPTYMVVKQLGLINQPLVLILLGSFSTYNMIIARSFFKQNLPDELFEAASIDGCGNGRFFFSMVIPLSKAIIAVLTLFYASGHWNSYFNALIYVNDEKLYPLQLILRDILVASQMISQDMSDPESAMEMQRIAELIKYGVIIVATVPMLILYPFVQRFFVQGVMIGSVKG